MSRTADRAPSLAEPLPAPADRVPGAGSPDRAGGARVRMGVLYGVAAYGAWGLFPLYFKAVQQAVPLEVLMHRIFWSAVLLVVLSLSRRRLREVVQTLTHPGRVLATLCLSTVLIASNWLVYIWAVANDRVVESSLGYFINPLVSVLLGVVFLGERLRRVQVFCVLLAGAGVAYLTIMLGRPPALALFLAVTFAFYGLLRKTVRADALLGLTVETLILSPLAATYLVVSGLRGQTAFIHAGPQLTILLALAGVVTALPLIWFTAAARRLRLATIGFLQYLAPTGQFLLAVLAFGEPLSRERLVAFGCIWAALLIYSIDAARRRS